MTRGAGSCTFSIAAWLCAAVIAASVRGAAAQEPPKNFVFADKPAPVAEITFDDAEAHAHSLADFKGKILLLNVWATWCVPCRKEMPALDRLQASLGGLDFQIVPVSIDRGGLDAVRKFYNEIGIHNLAMYIDSSGQVLRQVRALGLPTTVLIDRNGQEIGRAIGPADWDAPEIAEFLRPFILNRDLLVTEASRGDSQTVHQAASDPPGLVMRGLRWLGALLNK
jgi:thiol-disulfide isomerase/thioredoxin